MSEKRPPIRYLDYARQYNSADKGFVKMRSVAVEDGNDWVCASYMAQVEHFVRTQCLEVVEATRGPLNEMLELVPEGYAIVQVVEETWEKYAKKEKIPGFVVEKLVVRFQGIFASVIGVDRFWKVLTIRSKIEQIPKPTKAEQQRLLKAWDEMEIEMTGGIEKIVGGAVELEPEPPRVESELVIEPGIPSELVGAPEEIIDAYLNLPDLAKQEFLIRIRQKGGDVKEAYASYFPEIVTPTEAMILVEMEDMIAAEGADVEYRHEDRDPSLAGAALYSDGVVEEVPEDAGEWSFSTLFEFIDGMHPNDYWIVEEIIGSSDFTDQEKESLILKMDRVVGAELSGVDLVD